ncbi:MAG: hypothetical protein ACRD6X_13525, partial [Pyrinomonadaceae bacterium]
LGTSQVRNGKATADGFIFVSSVEFGEATIEISVRGTLAGNVLNGAIDSPQGTVPMTGTKIP